eukprot:21404-Heterococcus_DN1.PRE.1
MLCGHLDLLPPDPARLPDRSDDFLARMALHLEGGGQRIPSLLAVAVAAVAVKPQLLQQLQQQQRQ